MINELFFNYIIIASALTCLLYYILVKRYNLNFKFFIAYYDAWVGFYFDADKRILYFCPLPCLVFSFANKDYKYVGGKWRKLKGGENDRL